MANYAGYRLKIHLSQLFKIPEPLLFSQSLANRRHRLSQAMVRSTTHRLGWTTKPLTRSDRLTISISRSGRMRARAS